jgi:C4-dicarboxylate transporter, DctQ subunit
MTRRSEEMLVRLRDRLFRWHDWLTDVSFCVAMAALVGIALSFCYEVVARYFFNAPTVWASPVASYALCASIFFAMPQLTRSASHISLNLMGSMLNKGLELVVARAVNIAAAGACFLACWITAGAAANDFFLGILTNTYLPVPKWWLSMIIPYGMGSSGVYFLRQVFQKQNVTSHSGQLA